MKKKKLNFNATLMAEDASDVINALTEGLKEKRLHFQKGDDELLLGVAEAVNLSIEARYKDGKAKVTVEVVWDVPPKAEVPDSTPDTALGTAPNTAPDTALGTDEGDDGLGEDSVGDEGLDVDEACDKSNASKAVAD